MGAARLQGAHQVAENLRITQFSLFFRMFLNSSTDEMVVLTGIFTKDPCKPLASFSSQWKKRPIMNMCYYKALRALSLYRDPRGIERGC